MEAGQRIHLALGHGGINAPKGASGFIGLSLLERLGRAASISDRPPVATSGEAALTFLSQDTLKSVYRLVNADQYDPQPGHSTPAWISSSGTRLSSTRGTSCDRIWLVRKGRVKIVHHDEDGREVILEFISPGEAFGGAVLFFPTHPATAKALEDASLVSFPSEIYAQFLLDHPTVSLKLLRMLGVRHHSMLNMQSLAGERVERRMAHILSKLADRVGRQDLEGILITIPLSRQDLADMACTTLETAIRHQKARGIRESEKGEPSIAHSNCINEFRCDFNSRNLLLVSTILK